MHKETCAAKERKRDGGLAQFVNIAAHGCMKSRSLCGILQAVSMNLSSGSFPVKLAWSKTQAAWHGPSLTRYSPLTDRKLLPGQLNTAV